MKDCGEEMCGNWSGDGRVCPCALFGLDADECDPCSFCSHDLTRHRGDGCIECSCAVPA